MTGELEGVHTLYTKYCEQGLTARLRLAVMDHNYHVDRKQAKTKSDQPRKLQCSKGASGYVLKPIKQTKSHPYW